LGCWCYFWSAATRSMHKWERRFRTCLNLFQTWKTRKSRKIDLLCHINRGISPYFVVQLNNLRIWTRDLKVFSQTILNLSWTSALLYRRKQTPMQMIINLGYLKNVDVGCFRGRRIFIGEKSHTQEKQNSKSNEGG